jgi:PleD family two-component response regulator
MVHATGTPARVLLVGAGDLMTTVAGEVEAESHDVLRARDFEAGLTLALQQHPDVIAIHAPNGPDRETLDFCYRLRERAGPALGPVLLADSPPVSDELKKSALRAGVWHVLEAPIDSEELLLRIEVATAARREAERAFTTSLVDSETGLYNSAGLARRTRELSAEAMRTHSALACIVLSASTEGEEVSRTAAARSAEVLRTLGRLSDVVSRVGPCEFIVLAPGTSAKGAAQLARRLAVAYRVALVHALPAGTTVRTDAGFSSLGNLSYSPMDSADIMARASTALRVGRAAPHFDWINQSDLDRRATPPA